MPYIMYLYIVYASNNIINTIPLIKYVHDHSCEIPKFTFFISKYIIKQIFFFIFSLLQIQRMYQRSYFYKTILYFVKIFTYIFIDLNYINIYGH